MIRKVNCRDSFEEFASYRQANSFLKISSILMVGALINEGNLSPRDQLRLRQSIYFFLQQGFQFKTEDVDVSSLFYGHDFIADPEKYDLVILCWVNKGWSDENDPEISMESPLLVQGESWENALGKSEATFIINDSDLETCVHDKDIPSKYYKKIGEIPGSFGGMSVFYRIA